MQLAFPQNRVWQRDQRDQRCIATDPLYAPLVSFGFSRIAPAQLTTSCLLHSKPSCFPKCLSKYFQAMPPQSMSATPINCVTTKFIRTSTNKIKCPIFCVCVSIVGVSVFAGTIMFNSLEIYASIFAHNLSGWHSLRIRGTLPPPVWSIRVCSNFLTLGEEKSFCCIWLFCLHFSGHLKVVDSSLVLQAESSRFGMALHSTLRPFYKYDFYCARVSLQQ